MAWTMPDKQNIDQLFNLKASFPTKEDYTAFFKAAEKNDMKALGAIIDKWPDAPKKWNQGGKPVIPHAYKEMTVPTINYLVSRGADIDAFDSSSNWSAVQEAAFLDYRADLEKLLRCGAACDRRNTYGKTPLQYAAEKGNFACADMLVLCGANPYQGLKDVKNDDMRDVINSASKRREAFLASLNPPATDAAAAPVPEPVPVASDNVIHIMRRIELKKAGKDPGPDVIDEKPSGENAAKRLLKRVFKW